MKGLAWMAVVEFKKVRQGLPLLEGNEGQQHVAGQCQIERGVGFAVAVAVFLPGAGVAFVMVPVFHRPMFTHGAHGPGFFFRGEAGEEKAGVAVRRGERGFFLRPVAPDGEGATGARQPGGDGRNGGDGGAAAIQSSVFAFLAQVKKGVSLRACAAPARRWEVLALVPMR